MKIGNIRFLVKIEWLAFAGTLKREDKNCFMAYESSFIIRGGGSKCLEMGGIIYRVRIANRNPDIRIETGFISVNTRKILFAIEYMYTVIQSN